MERIVAANEGEVAAVIVEPLVQGAAGMLVQPARLPGRVRRLCRPLWRAARSATRWRRLRPHREDFRCSHEQVAPDLMCVAKGITGGYLPLAATFATELIYEGFLGRHEDYRTFFHGHTFTGNPLACAAAIATLRRLRAGADDGVAAGRRSSCSNGCSRRSRTCPTSRRFASAASWVGIEVEGFDPALRTGHRITLEARAAEAIIRPLGDVIVLILHWRSRAPRPRSSSRSPASRSRPRPGRLRHCRSPHR